MNLVVFCFRPEVARPAAAYHAAGVRSHDGQGTPARPSSAVRLQYRAAQQPAASKMAVRYAGARGAGQAHPDAA